MLSVLVIQKRELSLTADQNFIIKTFSENRKSLKKSIIHFFPHLPLFHPKIKFLGKTPLVFYGLEKEMVGM